MSITAVLLRCRMIDFDYIYARAHACAIFERVWEALSIMIKAD